MNEDLDIWVFLSHSNKDYEKVRLVRNLLEEQHFRPIMFFLCCMEDKKDELDDLIKREIDSRTRFILCDSENARNSHYVQMEVDYIKKMKRSYQIIDLSKPENEIAHELLKFKNKATVFISYSRNQMVLAENLYVRLKRYDYFVFFDVHSVGHGVDIVKEIKKGIDDAKNDGYFLCFIDNGTLKSSMQKNEIRYALDSKDRQFIIPIYLERNLVSCQLLDDLKECNGIDVSDSSVPDDDIIAYLLNKTSEPGDLLSYASDFRRGKNREKNLSEAEFCWNLYETQAINSPNPYALIALAKCYETGSAVDMNLRKAFDLYETAIHMEGLTEYIPDAQRLGKQLGIISNP